MAPDESRRHLLEYDEEEGPVAVSIAAGAIRSLNILNLGLSKERSSNGPGGAFSNEKHKNLVVLLEVANPIPAMTSQYVSIACNKTITPGKQPEHLTTT